LFKHVWRLHQLRGLSAAVYTQTTDVETECNGLLTYDRAVAKIDPALSAGGQSRRVFRNTDESRIGRRFVWAGRLEIHHENAGRGLV
jgi:hypothetical protein